MDLRLHGAVWKSAGPRREEWQRALEELNAENDLVRVGGEDAGDLSVEVVRLPSGAFSLRLYADVFERVDAVSMDSEALDALFSDYAQTIQHMVHMHEDAPSRGFESLAQAKRVVHDEAASCIQGSRSSMLVVTQEAARRLFTLLFLIAGDLPERLVRFHRFH